MNSFHNLAIRGRQQILQAYSDLNLKRFMKPKATEPVYNSNCDADSVNHNDVPVVNVLHDLVNMTSDQSSVPCSNIPNLHFPKSTLPTSQFVVPVSPQCNTTVTKVMCSTTSTTAITTTTTVTSTRTTSTLQSYAFTTPTSAAGSSTTLDSQPMQKPVTSQTSSASQETTFLESLKTLLNLQLPQLDISKFDGDLKKYEQFKFRFNTLVTGCNVIPGQRATLLYQSLTDEVIGQLDPIHDLQRPGVYEKMWDSLDREFGSLNLEVIAHVSALASIQTWNMCETSDDLNTLYRFVRYHYNALKRLGQEWQAEVSRLHVLGKLPQAAIDKCFDSGLIDLDNDGPVIPDMLSLMRKEVGILKLLEIAKKKVASRPNISDESSSGVWVDHYSQPPVNRVKPFPDCYDNIKDTTSVTSSKQSDYDFNSLKLQGNRLRRLQFPL